MFKSKTDEQLHERSAAKTPDALEALRARRDMLVLDIASAAALGASGAKSGKVDVAAERLYFVERAIASLERDS